MRPAIFTGPAGRRRGRGLAAPSIPSCCKPRHRHGRACTSCPAAKTFRWRGKYLPNMNDRETLEVHLNVFEHFDPVLPEAYRQLQVTCSWPTARRRADEGARPGARAALIVADTMDLWINIAARRAAGAAQADRRPGAQRQRSQAADRRRKPGPRRPQGAASWGPKFVVIKKGRARGDVLQPARDLCPARLSHARRRRSDRRRRQLCRRHDGLPGRAGRLRARRRSRKRMAYGIVVASFNVEDFSLDRMKQIEQARTRRAAGRVSANAQLLEHVRHVASATRVTRRRNQPCVVACEHSWPSNCRPRCASAPAN